MAEAEAEADVAMVEDEYAEYADNADYADAVVGAMVVVVADAEAWTGIETASDVLVVGVAVGVVAVVVVAAGAAAAVARAPAW